MQNPVCAHMNALLRRKSFIAIPTDLGTEWRHPWARGRAALGTAWSGVWSVVGDLYSQIGRTLSTNWNLKFQRGKKKKAEGTFACVEMTTLVTFPWDFYSLSYNWASCFPNSLLGQMVVADQGPRPCSGLSCSGELSDPSSSLLHLRAKEKPLQPCSGLGAASDMEGVTWSRGCKGQRWHR